MRGDGEERGEVKGWTEPCDVPWGKAASPYCWELWTPNALSETKTAINYSTGTERTSYRGEGMGGEEIWGEGGGIEEIYPGMGVRHKGFDSAVFWQYVQIFRSVVRVRR